MLSQRLLRAVAAQGSVRHLSSVPRLDRNIAVAFDVDGVLLRGKKAIPRAKEALQALEKREIPYVLLTNGGGYTERAKAQAISDIMGHPIDPQSLALAHSPFRALADDFRDKPVLVVGKSRVHQIAWEYGFENVYDVGDLHHQWPGLFPDWSPLPKSAEFERIDPAVGAAERGARLPPRDVHAPRLLAEPLACVLTFMDPQHYHRDLQILTDVIRSNGFPGLPAAAAPRDQPHQAADASAAALPAALLHQAQPLAALLSSVAGAPAAGASLPVFFAGPDMEYVTDWHAPRFGSGIFAAALTHLLSATATAGAPAAAAFGGCFVGKPHPLTYRYAEVLFETQARGLRPARRGSAPASAPAQREAAAERAPEAAVSSPHGVRSGDRSGGLSGGRRVYMVGDNPKSDIRGALDQGWHAILVRSGMFTGPPGSNDPEHPADAVVDDVMAAVEYIISRESQHCASLH